MKNILLITAAILVVTYSACKKEKETVTVTNTVTVRDTVAAQSITTVIGATHDATIKAGIGAGTLDSNYASGKGEVLAVGVAGDYEVKFRTLVQFDLSSLPAGANITDARLSFTLRQAGTRLENIYVHKLTENWEKGTVSDNTDASNSSNNSDKICSEITTAGTAAVTWRFSNYSTLKKWSTPGGTADAASDSANSKYSNGLSFQSPGIMQDVKNWQATPANNFGWVIRYNDAQEVSDNSSRLMRYISTDGGGGNGGKPKLIITYTMP